MERVAGGGLSPKPTTPTETPTNSCRLTVLTLSTLFCTKQATPADIVWNKGELCLSHRDMEIEVL